MGRFNIDGVFYEAASYAEARAKHLLSKGTVAGSPAPVAPPPPVSGPAQVVGVPVRRESIQDASPPGAGDAGAGQRGQEGASAIQIVHRADSRDLDDSSIKRDRGFACQNGQWCIREVLCARTFVQKLLDPSLDTSKVGGFEFAATVLTPVQINFRQGATKVRLQDVMATIKRVLKDTRAFWVSTSLNEECGGYATRDDYNCYRFTLPRPLKHYELVLGETTNTLKKVERRSADQVPTLCMDGELADGSDSRIFAINSGPINDCEISFLTRIDQGWVELIKKKVS